MPTAKPERTKGFPLLSVGAAVLSLPFVCFFAVAIYDRSILWNPNSVQAAARLWIFVTSVPVGFVFGVMAFRRANRRQEWAWQRSRASLLIAFSAIAAFPLTAIYFAPIIKQLPKDDSSYQHLKAFYSGLEAYAREHGGMYPPMAKQPGKFMFDANDETMAAFTDGRIFISETDVDFQRVGRPMTPKTEQFDDWSFFYLGRATTTESELIALLDEYEKNWSAAGVSSGSHEPTPRDSTQSPTLRTAPRLRDVLPDADPSKIPIVIERPDNHKDGGNVLYLDGRVRFHAYPREFPYTKAIIERFLELDSDFANASK
jgi:prepilin-type processing-associated H-X9-DG protein